MVPTSMFTTSRSLLWSTDAGQDDKMESGKHKPMLPRPSGKDYLWGGRRLNDEFEKNIDMDPLAETWECSTHPDGASYVADGEFSGLELCHSDQPKRFLP